MSHTRSEAVKWAAYSFLLLAVYLVQSTAGLRLGFFGYAANLTPFLVASVALFEGHIGAASFGFAAGLLVDLSNVGPEGLWPGYYLLYGAFAGYFALKYFRPTFLAGLIFGAGAIAVAFLFQCVFYLVPVYGPSLLFFVKTFFSELLVSMVFSPLVFFPAKYINRYFSDGN